MCYSFLVGRSPFGCSLKPKLSFSVTDCNWVIFKFFTGFSIVFRKL